MHRKILQKFLNKKFFSKYYNNLYRSLGLNEVSGLYTSSNIWLRVAYKLISKLIYMLHVLHNYKILVKKTDNLFTHFLNHTTYKQQDYVLDFLLCDYI